MKSDPSSRGKRAKQKGAQWERDVAKMLREAMGLDEEECRRAIQSDGSKSPDVICPTWHVECKVGQRPNLLAAFEQATRDAQKSKKIPVVVSKQDRKEPMATLSLDIFLKVMRKWAKNKRDENARKLLEGDDADSETAQG